MTKRILTLAMTLLTTLTMWATSYNVPVTLTYNLAPTADKQDYMSDNSITVGETTLYVHNVHDERFASSGNTEKLYYRKNYNGFFAQTNNYGYFSILDLKANDKVTITCSENALAFKSTNAYLASDENRTAVEVDSKVTSDATYVISSAGRLDLYLGSNASVAITKVIIETTEATEFATPTNQLTFDFSGQNGKSLAWSNNTESLNAHASSATTRSFNYVTPYQNVITPYGFFLVVKPSSGDTYSFGSNKGLRITTDYFAIANLKAGDRIKVTQDVYTDNTPLVITNSANEATNTIYKIDDSNLTKVAQNGTIASGEEFLVEKDGYVTFKINKGTVIKKIEILTSSTSTAEIVTAPSIAESNGTVTITPGTAANGSICSTYYTTDGFEPTTSSNKYTEPFAIDASEGDVTVKAITCIDYLTNKSDVTSKVVEAATYDITVTQPTVGGSFTVKVDDGEAGRTNTTAKYGQTITLTPSADPDYDFTSFSVKDSENTDVTLFGDSDTKTFTMPKKAVSITAVFTAQSSPSSNPTITFTTSSSGAGTVSIKKKEDGTAIESGNEIAGGTELILTASPESGYQLKSWKNGDEAFGSLSQSLIQTITMPASSLNITAEFEAQPSSVPGISSERLWNFDGFASGTILSGTKTYYYNGLYINGNASDESKQAKVEASVAATISNEYVSFDAVNNRITLSGALPTSSMDASSSKVNTIGSRNKNSVAFTAGVAGTVYVYMNGTYFEGRSLSIYSSDNMSNPTIVALQSNPQPQIVSRLVAANSNVFIGVSGGTAYIYAVKFVPSSTPATTQYTLKVTAGDGGTVKVMKGSDDVTTAVASGANYDEGTAFTLTATANAGYEFEKWTDGSTDVSTNNQYSISLSDNTTLVANFKSSGSPTPSSAVPVIITAGQSNTDGRIKISETEFPYTLNHTMISYCNGDVNGSYPVVDEGNFVTYGTTPRSDAGECWGYDAIIYNKVQETLGETDFYVIKQSKGNTAVNAMSTSGNNQHWWSANPVWLDRNTSANQGGRSLFKALKDNIDKSLKALEDANKEYDIKFLMWHQGEADRGKGTEYEVQMKAVIGEIRNYLVARTGNNKYSNLPVILGGIADVSNEYKVEVEAGKQALATADANVYYAPTGTMTLDEDFRSDKVHFNATGAEKLATSVWDIITTNGLMTGITLAGDDTPVVNPLAEDVVSETTTWNFTTTGDLTPHQSQNGLYNHTGTVKQMNYGSIDLADGSTLDGAYAVETNAADRKTLATQGLTAGYSGLTHVYSVNVSGEGTFIAVLRPKSIKDQSTQQYARLIFNGKELQSVAVTSTTDNIQLVGKTTEKGTFTVTCGETWYFIGAKFIKGATTIEIMTAPTIEAGSGLNKVKINPGTSDQSDATIKTYYTTDGSTPTAQSGEYTGTELTLTENCTVKAVSISNKGGKAYSEDYAFTYEEPTAATLWDFKSIYSENPEAALGMTEDNKVNVYYHRSSDDSDRNANFNYVTAEPVNSKLSVLSSGMGYVTGGVQVNKDRPFAIHGLKVGDVIRIEFEGSLYYAKNSTKGNALEGLTTNDDVECLEAYTVSSVDATNNYVVFFPSANTTISQITINAELTPHVMPTPKIKVKDESSFTYTISYTNGATLYYKKPGDSEYQMKTSGTSIDVQATKLGKIEAYATMNGLTSATASVTANVPTKAIEDEDGTYDFAKVKEMMSSDYVLGFGDAVTVGGFTLYKPDAVVATTLDQFAFAPKLKADGNKQVSANEWRLMAAGRLRATKSAIADTLGVLNLTKGQYVTFTYSGASLKYMSQSTAKLADGTDVLTSKQAYEVLSDGVLLLTVPADETNFCDITVISISGNEKVTPPTFTARDNVNEVTLRLGTSSFGKTVTAYYTTDGTAPTTSSTAVTKTTTIKVDESCTIKAYCVSETGKASTVAEYQISLEASGKSPSVVYDWTNIVAHSDTIKFSGDEVRVVYQAYNSSESTWKSTASSHFQPASSFDNKVSVLNGYKSLQYNNDNQTIRLTQPLAIHNLGVGDEIVIFYSGGDLYSAYDEAHDSYTVDGSAAKAGMSIISGAMIKVTKTMFSNNYIVVTPRGTTNSVTYIQAIYINHATPSYASTPKVALYDVVDTTAIYRFTFSEGTMLHYILEKEGVELQGNNKGTYDLTIGTSDRIKAWATSGTAVSDTLQTVLFAPTPAPSEEGGVDFTEASTDLPADLEVTLDPNKPVTVGGITLYKPTALTAATFDNRFAFTETNKSGKIRIRTNRTLMFAKGDNVNMGLLNLKQGDIVAFEFTGTIRIADGSSLSLESARAGTRESGTRADGDNLMESGSAYVVQKDGSLLLTIELTEASASINKMYVAAVPSKSKAAAIDFATASEEYETLAPGNATGVFYNGKTTAQTFYRLTNETRELPIDGKISTEGGAGEIINSGIKAGNRRIAIHALGKGDEIRIRFYGGNVTYEGHETKGDIVRVNGKRLAPGDTLRSGDVLKVEYVDYLNNYVVLKLDSKVSISGIFINRDEVEKIWMPTIVDQGSNTVLITAGRSSMDNPVSTSYTIDGSEPTERNGTSGPYEEFDVQLLGGNIVTIKAVSYNNRGMYSKVASLVIYASEMTDIPGITVDGNGQRQDVYDLYGRKVESLRRGQIYIVNGKKIFFK